SIPARRPRSSVGMVSFQIVPRNIALTTSAAPAAARHTTAVARFGAKPSPRIAMPQRLAAITTAMPWRSILEVHPLKRDVRKLPADIAEYSQPTAQAPPQLSAIAGKRAIGIANVMATISTA